MKIAILTGGPSLERGISLNSARSVLDHLGNENIEITPIYFNEKKQSYKISKSQLYSNNPSDFDFKLFKKSRPLSTAHLVKLLKSVDIVFPIMHGSFGEDGEIQRFLEKNNIPFIGSSSKACKMAFDKYNANKTINQNGFFTLPSVLLKIYSKNNEEIVKNFFKINKIKRAIVKPAKGGSSIGVYSVNSSKEAIEKANILFSKRIDTRVVVEPFAEGKEFTVIILENKFGMPVAILPTEIELTYHEGRIFDFRKKYLPTNKIKHHCPSRFSQEIIDKIQIQARQIFSLFKMNDFARFDGWVLDNGEVWFSDFNTVSGMEQNSFLFQQASRLGMSHQDLLYFIVKNSCKRQNINFPEIYKKKIENKKIVNVLFGGSTSERQVSLMSGTNVWLKLRKSKIYEPKPYLLDFDNNVWELPYTFTLNHTVEEIIEHAQNASLEFKRTSKLIEHAKVELMLTDKDISESVFIPQKISFKDFMNKSTFIFLGLHGGDGENGNIQKLLLNNNIKFNGSEEDTSIVCMDKFNTGEFIRNSNIKGISTANQKVVLLSDINNNIDSIWNNLVRDLGSKTLIIKPKDDGCSTGVAHLFGKNDLKNYLNFLNNKSSSIPIGILKNQNNIIEMPTKKINEIMFEKFIETDLVQSKGNILKYKKRSGWVEVTIGILEKDNKLHAFSPSVTISEGEVLSVEEKFQGGTGVNLTPLPREIFNSKVIKKTLSLAEQLAEKIGIKGYARIDAFMNVSSGNLLIIEVNTLPGLTPSTVIYHQALAEKKPIYPVEFLENLIKNKGY